MSVRPQRTPPQARLVAVTGSAEGPGRALVALLAEQGTPVRAVDRRPSGVAGVEERVADVLDGGLVPALAGAATVVHLAISLDAHEPAESRRARTVGGTGALLEAALEAGVRRVVLVTGVEVHGAVPDGRLPLPEDAPVSALADEGTLAADLLEVERLADHAGRTGLDVVVLRPATLVGGALGPAWDGQRLRRLGGTRLLATRGQEPLWQLCHAEDLVTALALAATGAVSGRCHVACDGWVEQERVEALAGRRRLELPPAVALSTADRLHRYGVVASSRSELADLLGPLVVEPTTLRAAGWRPRWSNEAALLDHLETRSEGPGGRTVVAAASAATAATALVGTAALVRRVRRRRRRA